MPARTAITHEEGRALEQLDSGTSMSKSDKFAAIALMCGPPTDDFRWNKQKAADFVMIARELFGVQIHRDIRGLYALYERWYAGEDLDRMLAERQKKEKAGGP